jgi:hypothetical protein
VQRGPIPGEHPNWEFILQPGRVWQSPGDGDYARASLPFALQERNANCTHYGVMTWLFGAAGKVSRIAYQISSETCAYFKFDMWGLLPARFDARDVANAADVIASYRQHEAARLPTKSISELSEDFPNVDSKAFGAVDGMNPADMTTFGIAIAGTHYRAECNTRHGRYPFCESVPLPSYSTAKSVFAGVAMMRLQKRYPGAKDLTIDVLIPECRTAKWSGVRIEDALDMATGNFNDAVPNADEGGSGQLEFLYDESHYRKLKFACDEYPHRADPGDQWVYHTSDTYLAGTAMSNLLYAQFSRRVDLYSDFLRPLWQELALSPLLDDTRRSYDKERQPFFGWGLIYESDDIAKLAKWISIDQPALGDDAVLDARLLAAALQRNPADRGLPAETTAFRYNNGFYAHDIAPYIACDRPVWVPFMSGYGGISVVMFPNEVIYYYFSDGITQRWRLAAAEINKIKGMCE